MMNYHQYLSAKTPAIYLADPNGAPIAPLQGIEKARLTQKFNDIWEIAFEVSRTTSGEQGPRENPSYRLLLPMRELYVEDYGWFRISKTPSVSMDGKREYKTFTAYGIESQLQDLDVTDFYVNCGSSVSREFFEENLDPLGIPRRSVRLYVSNPSDQAGDANYKGLGLLNLLEEEYLSRKGWSVGEVDLELRDKAGRKFEAPSQDLYSFLINTVAPAYRCIFVFDRIHKRIHVRNLETIGKTLNLECSFRNLISSAEITDKQSDLYTCFRVAGGDENVSVAYVNFGSDRIENLDYFIQCGIIPRECADKYRLYRRYRLSRQEAYTACYRDQLRLLRRVSDLEEQLPADEAAAEWRAYSLEELKAERDRFQAILSYLEERNTVNGQLQIEESPDYSYYLSIRAVILPDIEAEIARKEAGSAEEPVRVDYKTNWELYGIFELEAFEKSYENTRELLAQKGYDKPWDPSLAAQGSEEAHRRQYETYLKISGYLEAIRKRLSLLREKKSALEEQLKDLRQAQEEIVRDVAADNPLFGFTPQELALLEALRVQTDFTDSSIEAPDLSDTDTLLERSQELLQAAADQLEIESRPQLTYRINLENPLYLTQFSEKFAQVEQGDFIYLSLDPQSHVRQRCIEMEYELAGRSDASFSITFSDMITAYGKSNDYRFFLNGGASSGKNRISKSIADYVDSAAANAAAALGIGFGTSGLVSGMSEEDLLKLSDMLSGLVNGNLTLEELRVRLAQIDTLEADSAFIRYLNTQYLVANQADFKALSALAANIRQAVIGASSTETGIVIHLTSENANIDQLLVREQIAGQIRVGDLEAGDLTLSDQMRITSANGRLMMDGGALQIHGQNAGGEDYVGIQLGYDTAGRPSLIVRDEDGAAVLTSQGITQDAVADNLIQNRMLDNASVSGRNVDWSDISQGTDSQGRPVWDVSSVVIGGKDFGAEYTSFTQSAARQFGDLEEALSESAGTISGVSSRVSAVEKSVTDKVWQNDIQNSISSYDGSQIKTIREQVTETRTSVGAISESIREVEATLVKKADTSSVNELSEKTNELKSTVDGTTRELASLKTTVETKADGSAVTALESWKNTTQTTVEGFAAKIERLNTTAYGSKDGTETADGLSRRTLELEASVDGVRSRLEDTYTKGELDDNLESLVEQSVNGFKAQVKSEVKARTTPYYALGPSAAQPPDSGWSTIMPVKSAGEYLWRKDLLTYGDETSEWLPPYAASGSDGAAGPKGDSGLSAVSVLLSNESHTFAAGENAALASSVSTDVIAYYGNEREAVTVGSISGLPEGMSVSVSGNSTVNARIVFTVTPVMSAPSGTVKIPCTVRGTALTKDFSYSLSFAGAPGQNARIYELVSSALALKRGADQRLTPAQLRYDAYFRDGATDRAAYAGRFLIDESADGSSWTRRYTSSADESSVTYAPSNAQIRMIRCSLCASGGSGRILDQQSSVILTDIDNLQIGGRNLLLQSDTLFSGAAYQIAQYELGQQPPAAGETCTIQLAGQLGTGKTEFGVYNSGGNVKLCGLTPADCVNGVYSKTFVWTVKNGSITADNTSIRIYTLPQSVTGSTSSIRWAKLERGNTASDWSAAPEDYFTRVQTQAAIETGLDGVRLYAEKTYTTKGELGVQTGELRSAIEANSDSIRSTVSRQDYDRDFASGGGKITSILNQTASSYQMYFSGQKQEILSQAQEEAGAIADRKLENYGTYFEFSDGGMLIGKKGTQGNFKARFDNEQLAFLEGDNVVTWISNRIFHALGMETEGAMSMTNAKSSGRWVTEADATGRLNIYWRE